MIIVIGRLKKNYYITKNLQYDDPFEDFWMKSKYDLPCMMLIVKLYSMTFAISVASISLFTSANYVQRK